MGQRPLFFKNDGNAQIYSDMVSRGKSYTRSTCGFAIQNRRLLGKTETIYAFPSILFLTAACRYLPCAFLPNNIVKMQEIIGDGILVDFYAIRTAIAGRTTKQGRGQ